MQLSRILSGEAYKGTRDYINTQRTYEILRTVLLFGVSAALFVAGIIATKSRMNLLTVVAILGCLPASKSAVNMIMFCRYKSCSKSVADRITEHIGSLPGAFDCVFTSYEKNYNLSHLVVKSGTICGFTEEQDFAEQDFYKHLNGILQTEHFSNVTIKVFDDIGKYLERLEQLDALESAPGKEWDILSTIKSVIL